MPWNIVPALDLKNVPLWSIRRVIDEIVDWERATGEAT
jgi:hypothetical protein